MSNISNYFTSLLLYSTKMAAPWWCRVDVSSCLRRGRVLGGSGLAVGYWGLGLGASLLGPTCPLEGFPPWPLWQLFSWGGRLHESKNKHTDTHKEAFPKNLVLLLPSLSLPIYRFSSLLQPHLSLFGPCYLVKSF